LVKSDRASNPGGAPRTFDPFRDRVARDIRNALSVAFVAAWDDDGGDYRPTAARLRRRHPGAVYRAYIDRRLAAYRAASADRRALDAPDLLDAMVLLWNRALFFEVHELLEHHWHEARGDWREALKTMIQAAAVFVHREAGRASAAARLGRRVRARLEDPGPQLATIANLEVLRGALADPESPPPRLRRDPS
jgi:hypothetical protein